jgi:uridylate kinase
MPKYRRILLKLSGEALGGRTESGIDPARASEIASETAALARGGVEIGIVVGGGNFFRGVRDSDVGLRRTTVDSMGMLGTAINGLALVDLLRTHGVKAELMSAVAMDPIAPRYARDQAVAALEAGRVVVLAAGTGNPYFSTDSAAALRAIEIGAELMLKATNVDGVYDKDPRQHADAKRYQTVSYAEALAKDLAVIDATAVALCRENQMPVLVFNLNEPGALARAVEGDPIGTLMC